MWIVTFFIFFYYSSSLTAEQLNSKSYIIAIRPADCKEHLDGIPILYTGVTSTLNVYGIDFTPTTEIGFTNEDDCDYPIPTELKPIESQSSYKRVVGFTPLSSRAILSTTTFYACLKDVALENSTWIHQGTGKYVTLYVRRPIFPAFVWFVLIIICYLLSSLLTGLNLGLMSLDKSELQLLRRVGTQKERKYAEMLIPVRENGNLLVCSIVISSTLCNTVSTVITDMFFSGIVTVIITTIAVVLLCEIFPQSICSAHPLVIGARTVFVTRTCMIITYPVSYCLSKLLDFFVGKELAKSYNKQKLKEQIKKTNLQPHEQKMISGILEFGEKTVEEIMTVLDDIFKLPITSVLNFETIGEIQRLGYSRIPIYVGEESNIRYVLFAKDLAMIDSDAQTPVETLLHKSKNICHYVPKGTSLDKVLKLFKTRRSHMLFVTDNEHVSHQENEHCVIGLVTFEDVLEEIFQMEFVDETDTVYDNRGKRKISHIKKTEIISYLLQTTKTNTPSGNVRLLTFCYLSGIEEFSKTNITPKVLICVLTLDIYNTVSGYNLPQDTVYVEGVPADYFVMILEGQMNVKIGNEEMVFEVRPFRYFGLEAIRTKSAFIPDYTLQQGTSKALYLKIPITLYKAALLATFFDKSKSVPDLNVSSDELKYLSLILRTNVMTNPPQ